MGIKTLLGCILIVGLNIGIVLATNCPPTRTNTLSSESNSDSQAARECNCGSILDCYATTTPVSTTSTTSASVTSTSTASPSPSTDATNTEISYSSVSSVPANVTIVNYVYYNNSVTQVSSYSASSNTTSGPCQAVLVTELRRIKFLYLNYSQQQVFEEYIQLIELELLDITLTVTLKLIKCAYHLKHCFNKYPDIEILISCVKITGWGRIFEFIQAGLSFNAPNMKIAFQQLDNFGNCPLTQAIEAATANDSCGADTTVIALKYTGWMKRMCLKNDDDWPIERKHALISMLFKYYITVNAPPALLTAILHANIPGFGTVELYFTYCDMFVSFASIGNSFLGGDADNCPMLQSLNSSINSNETSQNYNSSVISECNNFVSNCHSYFKIEFDSLRRLKFVSAQFSFLNSLAHELLYKIIINGNNYQCPFYKIIAASHFSTNNNVTIYNQTVPQDYAHCCKLDKNNNSELLQALDYDFRPKLLPVYNSSFNTNCYNPIKNCIKNNADCNVAFTCVIPYLKNNCVKTLPQPRALVNNSLASFLVN